MPTSGTNSGIVLATAPNIQNVPVAQANTEIAITLPESTRSFYFRSRSPTKIQFAFAEGASSTDFMTIPPGGFFTQDNLDLDNIVLYLQTDKPSQTIEVLSWTRP